MTNQYSSYQPYSNYYQQAAYQPYAAPQHIPDYYNTYYAPPAAYQNSQQNAQYKAPPPQQNAQYEMEPKMSIMPQSSDLSMFSEYRKSQNGKNSKKLTEKSSKTTNNAKNIDVLAKMDKKIKIQKLANAEKKIPQKYSKKIAQKSVEKIAQKNVEKIAQKSVEKIAQKSSKELRFERAKGKILESENLSKKISNAALKTVSKSSNDAELASKLSKMTKFSSNSSSKNLSKMPSKTVQMAKNGVNLKKVDKIVGNVALQSTEIKPKSSNINQKIEKSPKIEQNSSKIGQNSSKIGQNSSKIGQNSSKIEQKTEKLKCSVKFGKKNFVILRNVQNEKDILVRSETLKFGKAVKKEKGLYFPFEMTADSKHSVFVFNGDKMEFKFLIDPSKSNQKLKSAKSNTSKTPSKLSSELKNNKIEPKSSISTKKSPILSKSSISPASKTSIPVKKLSTPANKSSIQSQKTNPSSKKNVSPAKKIIPSSQTPIISQKSTIIADPISKSAELISKSAEISEKLAEIAEKAAEISVKRAESTEKTDGSIKTEAVVSEVELKMPSNGDRSFELNNLTNPNKLKILTNQPKTFKWSISPTKNLNSYIVNYSTENKDTIIHVVTSGKDGNVLVNNGKIKLVAKNEDNEDVVEAKRVVNSANFISD